MHRSLCRRRIGTTALALFAFASNAPAVTIVGGSSLITPLSGGNQLEAWLGQGALTLTNIFEGSSTTSTAADFHAAVDGKGPTFSLIQIPSRNGFAYSNALLVGGYNPNSWSSDGGWTITVPDVARTAFIFNLSGNLKFIQRPSSDFYGDSGIYQTFNPATQGPIFRVGPDLRLYSLPGPPYLNGFTSSLTTYYAPNNSAPGWGIGANLATLLNVSGLDVGRIEVFAATTSPFQPTLPSPPPGPVPSMLTGSVGSAFANVVTTNQDFYRNGMENIINCATDVNSNCDPSLMKMQLEQHATQYSSDVATVGTAAYAQSISVSLSGAADVDTSVWDNSTLGRLLNFTGALDAIKATFTNSLDFGKALYNNVAQSSGPPATQDPVITDNVTGSVETGELGDLQWLLYNLILTAEVPKNLDPNLATGQVYGTLDGVTPGSTGFGAITVDE